MNHQIDRDTSVLHTPTNAWWGEAFTRLLLEAIPAQTRQIVELGCGSARSAHVLLPSLPDTRYLGLSDDQQTIDQAREGLRGAPFAQRVQLQQSPLDDLPLPGGSADLVLSLMTLQHVANAETVLAQARRVLQPGGRVVAVEPDNLGQRFYFDGVLEDLDQTFHRLCLRARVARQPADIAVGPRLPALLKTAGFGGLQLTAHAVHSSRQEDAKSFFARVGRIIEQTIKHADLPADSEEIEACEQAVNRALYAGLPKRVGFSTHLVPVFCAIGIRGED